MKTFIRCLLLAGLIALGVWAWFFFHPKPAAVIRQRLHTVAQLASFESGEGNLVRVAHIERLGGYFADDAQVMIDVPGVPTHTFEGREELMQAALSTKGFTHSVKVELAGIEIELNSDKKSAIVDATLKGQISNDNDLIVQELKFTMKVIDGKWLITRIETVKTLKP